MSKLLFEESFKKMEIPLSLTANRKTNQVFFDIKSIRDDRYQTDIYRYRESTGKTELFIQNAGGPVLAPDGKKLAYISVEQDGKRLIVVRNLENGSERILKGYTRIQDIVWNSDSNKILFSSAFMERHNPKDLIELSAVLWIDRVKFKADGEGLFDGSYREAAVWDLESEAVSVMKEEHKDIFYPCFIKNDKIAYFAIPENADKSDDFHIYLYTLKNGEKEVVPGPGGPIVCPSVSADGRYIACVSHDNRYWEATNYQIYLYDTQTSDWSCLTEKFDRSIGNYVINDTGYDRKQSILNWDAKGEGLKCLVTDGYGTEIYHVNRKDGTLSKVTDEQEVVFYYAETKDALYYIRSKENVVSEIISKSKGRQRTIWTSRFDQYLYECSSSAVFNFTGYDGSVRYALYYPAVGEQKGVVLNIHGGPHYCHGYDFSYDIQLLAAKGYGTVICNPAGSQGSGEELARASYHDWGGKDYRELMTCVETAKNRFQLWNCPWAVMGGSYGGFMTNWIISHTDIFQCAISERSTCNRYSQAGTSDCAFRYGKFEFDGQAWESPEHYMEHSPITYVRNVSTPVLLIHGDRDMNCPLSQSEEWYSALKMEDKEAYLAVFPGQYHNITGKGEPRSRLDRYRLLVWWLDRYMKDFKERRI